MKCPLQNWNQNPDDNQNFTDGKTVTQTVFELMDCGKENCGAWHDGKCCYAAVSLCNE